MSETHQENSSFFQRIWSTPVALKHTARPSPLNVSSKPQSSSPLFISTVEHATVHTPEICLSPSEMGVWDWAPELRTVLPWGRGDALTTSMTNKIQGSVPTPSTSKVVASSPRPVAQYQPFKPGFTYGGFSAGNSAASSQEVGGKA